MRAVGQRDDVALDGPLDGLAVDLDPRAPHGRIASLSCWATTSPPSTVYPKEKRKPLSTSCGAIACEVLERVVVEPQLGAALPDLGRLAVGPAGADELGHGRDDAVVGGEVAGVVHRRVVDGRAGLGHALERDDRARDLAVVRRAGRAEARARGHAVRRGAADGEGPGQVDRAELLREALDPAAVHREVLVDPDVDAAADGLPAERRADDEEELLVLALDGVDELVEVGAAGLPVGEDRRDEALPPVPGRGLELGRQQRGDRVRVRAVLDDEEVARVVPRRRRDEARAAVGGEGCGVALGRHGQRAARTGARRRRTVPLGAHTAAGPPRRS